MAHGIIAQQLYVAYFGRPADAQGLANFSAQVLQLLPQAESIVDFAAAYNAGNVGVQMLLNNFSKSAESAALYNGTTAEFVEAVYQNVLSRAAEPDGLAFWVDAIDNRGLDMAQVALEIMAAAVRNGAGDAVTVANKTAVAQEFTVKLDTPAEVAAYSGNDAAAEARAMLTPVDASTDVVAYSQKVDLTIATLLSDLGLNTSNVFTLTENTVRQTVVVPDTTGTVATKQVTYWGFNNPDLIDAIPSATNGVPISELMSFIAGYLADRTDLLKELNLDEVELDAIANITFQGVQDQIQDDGVVGTGDNSSSATGGDAAGDGSTVTVGSGASQDDAPFETAEGDFTGNYEIVVTLDSGDTTTAQIAISQQDFDFINGLLFDENGETRLFEKTVPQTVYVLAKDGEPFVEIGGAKVLLGGDGKPVTTDLIEFDADSVIVSDVRLPIVLTTTENNGGTLESGVTTNGDDVIVAGRLDLLHRAYIDGGDGVNTLEIDAKGHFAQPAQLLNIQNITLNNLPNIYTTNEESDLDLDGTPDDNDSQFPDVVDGGEPTGSQGDIDSIIDLSRAVDLENLTITEGTYAGLDAQVGDIPGDLTVTGVRGNATLTLEGAFTAASTITVQYGQGQAAASGLNLVLALGDTQGTTFNILQNSSTVNIESAGAGNAVDATFARSSLLNMNITGDAFLEIANDLAPSFQANTPATIDASANTAGVDLQLGAAEGSGSVGSGFFSDEVEFIGSTGDDHFDVFAERNVTITGQNGDNEFVVVSGGDVVITSGTGNNEINAKSLGTDGETEVEHTVSVTVGGGQNDIQVESTDSFAIVAGDGANRIDAKGGSVDVSLAGNGSVTEDDFSTIVVGDGQNEIDASGALLNITAGSGSNEISVLSSSETIITAGNGGNTIAVAGDAITVTTGTGNDSVKVVGTASDYVDEGSVLNINLGAGNNNLILGFDGEGESGIVAKVGSTIAGENITLTVENSSDLRAANLTAADIDKVVLNYDISENFNQVGANDYDLAPVLTLTDTQFAAIGAANFEVIGGIFGTYSQIKLIITQSTTLTALGVDSLPRGVDLVLEIQDGARVTMTAQQLHERIAPQGVTLAEDFNTDFASGSVLITGAGTDFDPFNNSDQVRTSVDGREYFGGSLNAADFANDNGDGNIVRSEWGFNVLVDRTLNGYNRPADEQSFSRLSIDTDTQGGTVGPFSTIETFLRITGAADMAFVPVKSGIDEFGRPIEGGTSIQLGVDGGEPTNGYMVDFSSAEGEITNLTLAHFENVQAMYGNGEDASPVRVNVEIGGDADDHDGLATTLNDATVASAERGLVSRGIQSYVVTTIDTEDNTAAFWTSRVTEDLDVLGLQGNFDDTITFGNTERGVTFLMEVVRDKFDGYAVGTLVADFARQGASAVVDVVGISLPLPSNEVQKVAGINVTDAASIVVNVTGGNTIVQSLAGTAALSLTLTADANLEVAGTIPTTLTSVDAAGVDGNLVVSSAVENDMADDVDFVFVGAAGETTLTLTNEVTFSADSSFDAAGDLTLNIAATAEVDVTAANVANVDAITIANNGELTITIAQTVEIGEANITGPLGATLNLVGLGEEAFSLANYDQDLVGNGTIILDVVDVDGNGTVTLNAATDLTGVASLEVPQGVTLNLTAAQFQQLTNAGTITGFDATGALTTDFAIVITGLTQADVDAGFDLSGITAANITVNAVENISLPTDDTAPNPDVITNIAEAGRDIVFNFAGFTLSVPELAELNGVEFNGTTLEVRQFTTASGNGQTVNVIDAAGFNVDTLRFSAGLVAGTNVDGVFGNLPASVQKVIFLDEGIVIPEDQTVTIEAGVTVAGSLTFNKLGLTEIEDFTVNLEGGVIIAGELNLRSEDEQDAAGDALHSHLKSLTINSNRTLVGTEAAVNLQQGGSANRVGLITSQDGLVSSAGDNNLLVVNINGDEDFVATGIVFESVTGDDEFTFNDVDNASATVTVNSTASTNLGTLDSTDSDVDSVAVVNAGTGTVTATVTGVSVNADDALSFTSTNGGDIVLNVASVLDLSDDVLTGVSQLNIVEGSTITLSIDQVASIGAANIDVVDGADAGVTVQAASLTINNFGAQAFDATLFDANLAITLEMAPGVNTINPAANLTNVVAINVPENGTLNLTAAQFQQLLGNGTITAFDANGDSTVGSITVNITDLTQADVFVDADADGEQDVGEGFDLSNVNVAGGVLTVSQLDTTVTLGSFDNPGLTTQALDTDVSSVLNGAQYILVDGQTLELVNSSQADELVVTGTGDTTVRFRFAELDPAQIDLDADANPMTPLSPQIDVSGYSVSRLETINVMYTTAGNGNGNENVEVILQGLPSEVDLVIFDDPLALGLVDARDRVVIIRDGVTVDGSLIFNDIRDNVELVTLSVTFENNATIDGDLRIPTVAENSNLQAANFNTLTLNSEGTQTNKITGDITAVAQSGSPDGTTELENRLTTVVINTNGADFVIGKFDDVTGGYISGGDIVFTALQDAATARLTINGDSNVTMHGVDVTDNDNNGTTPDVGDIANLVITNNSTGTLTMTGGSAAISATGAETLTLLGTGDIVLGNNDAILGETASEGLESTTLSVVNASQFQGDLEFGEIANIDNGSFTFIAGSGVTTATLQDADLDNVTPNPDTAGWSFDFTNAAAGSELRLDAALTAAVAGSTLSIDMGANGTLFIDQSMDLSDLVLSLEGAQSIVLADGATLTLTAAQASGLNIVGENGLASTGVVNIVNLTNDIDPDNAANAIDLSGIDASIAGTITLAPISGVDADVTLDKATDLGAFSVTLIDELGSNASLAGQTIRFQTVDQAERVILVQDIGNPTSSSTNVVWLFDNIAAPVDTSGYSNLLGRLFLNQDLINNEGGDVEELFTTLPNTILRVDFADLQQLNVLINSNAVDRVVELVHFTTLNDLTFNDVGAGPDEFIRNLELRLGGEVTIGDITLDDVIGGQNINPASIEFQTLTINSQRAVKTDDLLASELFVNDNDGQNEALPGGGNENVQPDNINTIGDIRVGGDDGIDFTSLVINTGTATIIGDSSAGAGAAVSIQEVFFESDTVGDTAELVVTGANNVTIKSIDVSDMTTPVVNVDLGTHSGVYVVTGGSPAAALGNAEEFNIITKSVDANPVITITADDMASGDESLTVNYSVNGVAGSITLTANDVNLLSADAIRDALIDAFNDIDGLEAMSAGAGQLSIGREPGVAFSLDGLSATAIDDDLMTTLAADYTNASGLSGVARFGTAVDGNGVPFAGVAGAELSEINVTGAGFVDLGTIALIDSSDDDLNNDGDLGDAGENIAFTLNGNGSTAARLGSANIDGVVTAPSLNGGSTWAFNGVDLTITEDVVFSADPMDQSILVINGGSLTLEGDVDLTNVDYTLVGIDLVVPEGSSVTLTIEQVQNLDFEIVGSGTLVVVGEVDGDPLTLDGNLGANANQFIRVVNVDLSNITFADAMATEGITLDLNEDGAFDGDGNLSGFNVIGTAQNDVIADSELADTITAGAGDDTVTLTVDSVTGFDGDEIDLGGELDDQIVFNGVDANQEVLVSFVSAAAGNGVADGTDGLPAVRLQLQDDGANGDPDDLVGDGVATRVDDEGLALSGAKFNVIGLDANGNLVPAQNRGVFDDVVIGTMADDEFDFSIEGDDYYVNAGMGNDTIVTGSGSDFLVGGDGNDDLNGGSGADTILAGAGDDTVNGGEAIQTMTFDVLGGGAGEDLFVFDTQTSIPGVFTKVTDVDALDAESILFASSVADADPQGTELVTVQYRLNSVSAAINVVTLATDTVDEIAAKVQMALNGITGITSVLDAVDPSLVLLKADDGGAVEVLNVVPNGGNLEDTIGEPMVMDYTDVPQEETVTLDFTNNTTPGLAAAGETYTVTIALADGGSVVAEIEALGGETEQQIAQALVAELEGNDALNDFTIGAVIQGAGEDVSFTITDDVADNGGFIVTANGAGAFAGSGASTANLVDASDLVTADVITDFVSTTDKISFGLVDGDADSYDETDVAVDDFAAALAAAETFFGTGGTYFFAEVANVGGTDRNFILADNARALGVMGEEGTAYGALFFDANGDGTADGVVELVGITANMIGATDIQGVVA